MQPFNTISAALSCADIVFLDLQNVNYIPLNNPVHQIVNCEDSTSVHTVMINGHIVLQDRKFVGFDFAAMRDRVETAMDRLDSSTIEEKRLAQMLEPIVGSYCVGLQKMPYPIKRTLYCGCNQPLFGDSHE